MVCEQPHDDAARQDSLVGTTLDGRFYIEEVIGRGGMSVVYRARQMRVERDVAIKTLRMQVEAQPVVRERFNREISTLSTLSHPNIVTVYDCVFGFNDQPYIVMDYLRGSSLDALLRRSGALRLERAIAIALQVMSALDHAHRKGVVHRDLKPANIVLIDEESDLVKVVDFGLAKFGQESRRLTRSGELWGSPPYMSPEQALGNACDARSDIYSLGAVVYEMLTGRDPFFSATTVYELICAHASTPPPAFDEANPDARVPSSIQSVVFKSLAKNPDERFQTVPEFQAALLDALSGRLEADTREYVLRFASRSVSGHPLSSGVQQPFDLKLPGTPDTVCDIYNERPIVAELSGTSKSVKPVEPSPRLIVLPWAIAMCSLSFATCLTVLFFRFLHQAPISVDHAPKTSSTGAKKTSQPPGQRTAGGVTSRALAQAPTTGKGSEFAGNEIARLDSAPLSRRIQSSRVQMRAVPQRMRSSVSVAAANSKNQRTDPWTVLIDMKRKPTPDVSIP